MSARTLLCRFRQQSVVAHAGLLIAGAAAFVGGAHLTALLLYEGPATFVESGEPLVRARRRCFTVGFVAAALTFAVGSFRAVGGPVLNFLYPFAVFVAVVFLAYEPAFGPPPDHLFSGRSGVAANRTAIRIWVPGSAAQVAVVVLGSELAFDSEAAARAWLDRHVLAAFLEAYWDDYENGEWTDPGEPD